MRISLFAAIALSFLAACGDDSGGTSSSTSSGGGTACDRDTRKDVYAAGMAKTGAGVTVKILDAQPSPPSKGKNTLTLQVLDAGGKPVDGATLSIVPTMPDHGHGTSVVPVVTPLGADGKYTASDVYLAMAGLWEVKITVQVPGGATSDVTFAFCLDG